MEDIHDIKIPIETPLLTQNLIHTLWWCFGLLCLFIIAYFIYRYYKKKKLSHEGEKIQETEKIKTKEEFQKLAMDKLVSTKKYIDLGEYKTFHLEVSEIVKEYLGNIYRRGYSDMTSKELSRSQELQGGEREQLVDLLRLADMAKFAQKNHEEDVAQQVYKLALEIIK